MKTPIAIAILSVSIQVPAQLAASNNSVAVTQPVSAAVFIEGQCGPNSREWLKLTSRTNASGQIITRTNKGPIELATGLMYWETQSSSWKESKEQFQLQPDGSVVASQGQHQLTLAPNLNAAGSVRLTLPAGQTLVSQPMFLSFYNQLTGTSVLIAQVTNCSPQLISSNTVLFANCFDSGIQGSIRYVYRKDGMDQEILLYQSLDPANWGLTNAGAVTLDMFTEFTSGPAPVIQNVALGGGAVDQTLSFPQMEIGQGRAFLVGQDEESLAVQKSWQVISGKTFLIESVPYTLAAASLSKLPPAGPQGAFHKVAPSRAVMLAGARSQLGIAVASSREINPAVQRSGLPSRPAFLLDYTILNTSQVNFAFDSDSTYYISGNVDLRGTNTTFESCVLKMASNVTLTVDTPVTWLASAFRPLVIVPKDYDGVGEQISGSTGNPGTNVYAARALSFNAANVYLFLDHLRIANAQTAVAINGGTGHVLKHVQLVNCGNGIAVTNTSFALYNALFDHVLTNFTGNSSTADVEHLTVDTANWLNPNSGVNLALTNCLLVAVANTNGYIGQNVNTAPAGNGVFQSVLGGYHYLVPGSTNQSAGTTNINPGLAVDLRKMTTSPPTLLTNNFTSSTVLSPVARRGSTVPDIGYSYDALDFAWDRLILTNATLLLTNGVDIGFYGSTGLVLELYSNFISQGLADNLDHIVWYSSIQEHSLSESSSAVMFFDLPDDLNYVYWSLYQQLPQFYCRFSDIASLSLQGSLTTSVAGIGSCPFQFWNLHDSALHDLNFWCFPGGSYSYPPGNDVLAWTNSLFERCNMSMGVDSYLNGNQTVTLIWHNNLFWWGASYVEQFTTGESSDWSFRDNAFDNINLDMELEATPDAANNGYINVGSPFSESGAISISTFKYATGVLGPWYQSSTNFVNQGSTTANLVGLYHYTTQVSQVKEANSIVDIGLHYVAVNGNGNPIDSNGNGIPDYIEDPNGAGIFGPSITLTAPYNNTSYTEPATIPIQAVVSDWSSVITNVDLNCGSIRIISLPTAPYQYSWPIVSAGRYNLTGLASDLAGLSATSSPVTITVTNLCGF